MARRAFPAILSLSRKKSHRELETPAEIIYDRSRPVEMRALFGQKTLGHREHQNRNFGSIFGRAHNSIVSIRLTFEYRFAENESLLGILHGLVFIDLLRSVASRLNCEKYWCGSLESREHLNHVTTTNDVAATTGTAFRESNGADGDDDRTQDGTS